jgi:rubrerythrin
MTENKSNESGLDLKVNQNTSPAEAARIALNQEIKARKFYEECAKIMKNPGAKKMFEFLAAEERKHEDLIQREIDSSFMQEM